MFVSKTYRPRNVGAIRAAGILYGDWGTSKAYVIGLAFAIAGYSSFWLILAVSILSVIIGINYTLICKYYPSGGGVYTSVRRRSEVLSMVGAFFIIADYFVTAGLSCLSAFSYFGVAHPIIWSAIAILFVGILNYFGPKHTGGIAFAITIPTVIVLIFLIAFSIPNLKIAVQNLEPITTTPLETWKNFVSIIVALSGIEAIANATGVMRLNKGSNETNPIVTHTSTPAIVWVMIEVAVFTSIFGLAMLALDNLVISNGTVNAPGNPGVRDYMLRYMGEIFSAEFFGAQFGQIFGIIISVVIGALLLSAVNTAIIGLVAVIYLMSKDGEIPSPFQKLNHFGVPVFPLLVATTVPILLIVAIQDIAGLADLYAIGFVGAIAANLGSTSTDLKLPLKLKERIFMFLTFLVMITVELSLFYDKPKARMYALLLITTGLILRSLTKEQKDRKLLELPQKEVPIYPEKFTLMVSTNKPGKSLDYAIQKAKKMQCHLYVLFVREQGVISEADLFRKWENDIDAVQLFDEVKKHIDEEHLHFLYTVTDAAANSIVHFATRFEVNQLIIGLPKYGRIVQLLQGNLVRDVNKIIPKHIQVLVVP